MAEDEIVKKLLEHDEKFAEIRREISDLRRDTLQGQDEMIGILRRLDQERIFTTEWVKRIESEVEKQKSEISRIKEILKIS